MTSGNFEAEIPERGLQFLARGLRRKAVFPRIEVEAALVTYFDEAEKATKSGDWNSWADLFTKDAIYVEHAYGVFRGQEAIRNWVTTVTESKPSDLMMTDEWHMIDNDLCIVYASNSRRAPEGGRPYCFNAVAILCYAGDGQWCYEEDVYNAVEAKQVMEAHAAATLVAEQSRD